MKASTHHPFESRVVDRTASPWLRDALWVVVLMGTVGCADGPVSLTRDRQIVVESASSAAGRLWWIDVRASVRRTWVEGEVIRHKEWPADRMGHIDVAVISADGAKVAVDNVALVPVQTVGGDSRRLAFTAPLAQRPPPGSTLRVIHHSSLGAGETGPAESGGM